MLKSAEIPLITTINISLTNRRKGKRIQKRLEVNQTQEENCLLTYNLRVLLKPLMLIRWIEKNKPVWARKTPMMKTPMVINNAS